MSLVVCDSSALVAVLVDGGADGRWAAVELEGRELAAPALVDFEVANVLRRLGLANLVSPDAAAQAHADLLALPIQRWPYESVAQRAWQLRGAVTAYDASYVAVAELLEVPLVTLDGRLRRTTGPACEIRCPG